MSTHIVSPGHGYRAAGNDWQSVEGPAVVFTGNESTTDFTPRLVREAGADWVEVDPEVAVQWDRLRRGSKHVLDSLRGDPDRVLTDEEWKAATGAGVPVIAAGFVESGGAKNWRVAGPFADFLATLHDAEV